MRRVHVVALGGTIAMTGEGGRDVKPTLDAERLLAAVPELDEVADVTAETFVQAPGAHLRLGDLVAFGAHLYGLTGVDGVVVTQGTDTIEETSFALELLGPAALPLVVTGAMRNPSQPGADGAANLLNAVRLAATDDAQGMGTLVLLDDTVHTARFVRKAHTSRPSAFASPTAGPVGWVAEGRARVALRPGPGPRLGPGDLADPLPAVGLVTAALGDDGRLLREVRGLGYAAVVVEAFGAGHVPDWYVAPLTDLAARIPVVLASRTGGGEVFRGTYGFEGSERDLLERGLLWGGALDALKLRLLVTFGLGAGWDRQALAAAIAAFSA